MWSTFKSFFGIHGREIDFQKNSEVNRCMTEVPHNSQIEYESQISDNFVPQSFGFTIVTDPVQMHSYLEKQMDDMFKNIFNFSNIFQGTFERESVEENSGNLRDEFLKPGYNQHFQEDSDLDGVINSTEIENYFNVERPSAPTFFSRSVVIQSTLQPDGTMKTVRIERNHENGDEKTVMYDSSNQTESNGQIDLSDIDRISKLFFKKL